MFFLLKIKQTVLKSRFWQRQFITTESKGYLEETIDVIVGHPHIKIFMEIQSTEIGYGYLIIIQLTWLRIFG